MTVAGFLMWLVENDIPGDAEIMLDDDRGGYPMNYPSAYRFGGADPVEVHLS